MTILRASSIATSNGSSDDSLISERTPNPSVDEQALAKADSKDNASDDDVLVGYYIDLKKLGESDEKSGGKIIFSLKESRDDVEKFTYLCLVFVIIDVTESSCYMDDGDYFVSEQERWPEFCNSKIETSIQYLKNSYKQVEPDGSYILSRQKEIPEDKIPDNLELSNSIDIYTIFECFSTLPWISKKGECFFDPRKPYRDSFGGKYKYASSAFFKAFEYLEEEVANNIKAYTNIVDDVIAFINAVNDVKALMKTLYDEFDKRPDIIYSYYDFMRDINMETTSTLNIVRMLVSLDQIISIIGTHEKAYELEIHGADKNKIRESTKGKVHGMKLGLERFLHFDWETSKKLYNYRKKYMDTIEETVQKNVDLNDVYREYCPNLISLRKKYRSMVSDLKKFESSFTEKHSLKEFILDFMDRCPKSKPDN